MPHVVILWALAEDVIHWRLTLINLDTTTRYASIEMESLYDTVANLRTNE